MEDGAQAQARARGPEERILWPPDHGAAAHPEQQWAGHDAYAPAAMHQVTTVHGAGGQAWPPAQAPQGPATDDAWPSEAASSCPGQQQQHFAGPTKSVKFSAQQEHQQLTQGGQRIVTIVSQHAMQDDERACCSAFGAVAPCCWVGRRGWATRKDARTPRWPASSCARRQAIQGGRPQAAPMAALPGPHEPALLGPLAQQDAAHDPPRRAGAEAGGVVGWRGAHAHHLAT